MASSIDATRVKRFTAAGLLVLGLTTLFAQQLSLADPADQETAKLVAQMIPQYHLSRARIDEDVSSRLLDRFLKDLDPQKLYFLQTHIDQFEPHRRKLGEQIKDGNVDFAYKVFELYQERMDKQIQVAHQWIDEEHDFSIEEHLETDSKKIAWAKDQEELDDRWRRRIKYDLLQFKLDGQTSEEARERLHKRYRNNKLAVDQYTTVDQLEMYLTALTQCFDPHSTYMSPNTWEDFEIQMKLSLDGIGAALRSDDGYTIVAQVVPGGAAAEDGRIKQGDRIIGVGQEDGEIVDIFEMKLSEVVRMIRGPRGTKVRLQVRPKEGGDMKTITLTRRKIELKESEIKGEVIDAGKRLGRPGRIGVISLPSFYRDFAGAQNGQEFKSAAQDVAKVLAEFSDKDIDVVVIDLRNNGGGALTEAIDVSGHFIDRGPVVQVKDHRGQVKSLNDEESGVLYSGPLVVLCNRLSASASEIFAGVIKDYRRGLVVGDTTTHGKGTVQSLIDVAPRNPLRFLQTADRGKLKLTIQQFYRVNGDSTQSRGVRSDIVLPSLIDHWDLGEAYLDGALPFEKIEPARYQAGRMVSSEMVSALQKNSEARRSADDEFQKLEKTIERYLVRKDRTLLSLNEEQMRRDREADEQIKEEKPETDPEPEDDDGPVFKQSYYNDEVLHIALDYVAAINGKLTVAK
jgi:carboxyl-terminal processing protease